MHFTTFIYYLTLKIIFILIISFKKITIFITYYINQIFEKYHKMPIFPRAHIIKTKHGDPISLSHIKKSYNVILSIISSPKKTQET